MLKFKIVHVAGARPNFMKVAPIMAAIKRYNASDNMLKMEQILVHTGQHYDYAMSQTFFDDLGMSPPDYELDVKAGSHSEQTAKILTKFEILLLNIRPDLVIVVGDVNSTMACALAAKKLNMSVAHIEAGLRSGDMSMPEEVNRKITDCIADYLFTTEKSANYNLKQEGVSPEQIFYVGNVMVDSLLSQKHNSKKSSILERVKVKTDGMVLPYALLTLHRPSNVDNQKTLNEICDAIIEISTSLPVIFPCHPRTASRLEHFGLTQRLRETISGNSGVTQLEPLGYRDFLALSCEASVILTDSGGIQEEATILGIPCLTLRYNTERPVTILEGTNRLCGNRREEIVTTFNKTMKDGKRFIPHPDKWDGKAADRIVENIVQVLKFSKHTKLGASNCN